jgi:hypothetical protein
MSSSMIPAITKSPVYTNSTGICTVSDVSGLHVGQTGIISKIGQDSAQVYIVSINSLTTIMCREVGGSMGDGYYGGNNTGGVGGTGGDGLAVAISW